MGDGGDDANLPENKIIIIIILLLFIILFVRLSGVREKKIFLFFSEKCTGEGRGRKGGKGVLNKAKSNG
mgnify:CR=1 FL=1